MKNIIKSLIISLAAVSLFAGCAKEEGPVDPYSVNWTYLRPKTIPTQTAIVTDAHIVSSMFSTEDMLLTYIQCTKPAKQKIIATFEIDPSLVEAYNEANNTSCQLMQHVSLVNNTLTINKGEYVSADTLKISYDAEAVQTLVEEVNEETDFLLPITMKSVSSGANMSETRTLLVHYKILVKSVEQTDGYIGNLYTDLNSAKITINGRETTSLNDGDTYTDENLGAGSEIIVDFGKEVTICGIRFRPYADHWYEMCQSLSVSFSTDGTEYKNAGTFNLYQTYNYYLTFYSNKTIRYIKINTNGYIYSSSYGAWLGELEFYVPEI